jgi:SAM-dependent methyltransferase
MSEKFECVLCLLCGGADTQVVSQGEGPAQLVRCRKDGLVFLNPRPTAACLREFHQAFVRRDNLGLFDTHRRKILEREAEAVKQIVPGGNLLDLGCATGIFFDYFPAESWQLFGVDTSPLGVQQSRQHRYARIFQGSLADAQFPSDFFDVVTVLDTLYYVPDPRAELREARRILKEDGLLAVEIPGLTYTFLRTTSPTCWLLDRRASPGLADSRHLYHFSPATIRILLETAGFRLLHMIPEQASLGGGRARRLLNGLHFRLARAIHRRTHGKISIAGKELYLARKAPAPPFAAAAPPACAPASRRAERDRRLAV